MSRAGEGTAEFIELWSHSEAIVVGMTHSTFQRYSEILTLVLPESQYLEVMKHTKCFQA